MRYARNEYIKLKEYTILLIDSPSYGLYNVLIDNNDYELIKGFQWRLQKRARGIGFYIMNTKNRLLLHRLIMAPKNDEIIDHINRNPLDNRRSNLRCCNYHLNNINRYQPKFHKSHNKTTGIHGLTYFYLKDRNKWIYGVKVNGCKQGRFYSMDNAIKYLEECKQGLHKKGDKDGKSC